MTGYNDEELNALDKGFGEGVLWEVLEKIHNGVSE
jgi:hypothetical protein